jgi:hypothetical protein
MLFEVVILIVEGSVKHLALTNPVVLDDGYALADAI